MNKLVAVVNVIAWSGFWAFGYLALSADYSNTRQVMVALVLAALGAAAGLWAWFRLIRYSEHTGYAKAPKRAYPQNGTPAADGRGLPPSETVPKPG